MISRRRRVAAKIDAENRACAAHLSITNTMRSAPIHARVALNDTDMRSRVERQPSKIVHERSKLRDSRGRSCPLTLLLLDSFSRDPRANASGEK